MLGALGREAALGRDFVERFISSIFYERPSSELTRGDIDKWLLFYMSVSEDVEGIAPWAYEYREAARQVLEASLGVAFRAGAA
jgi:hypothetical protein